MQEELAVTLNINVCFTLELIYVIYIYNIVREQAESDLIIEAGQKVGKTAPE